MNNKIIKYKNKYWSIGSVLPFSSSLALAFTLFLSFFISGCTEYLEENPDSRIEPSTAEDYYAIITGAYPGAYHLFTEVMTDNYRFYDYNEWNSATLESWFKPLYLWSDNYSLNLPIGPEFAWDSYYYSIYKSNVVLEGIDDAEGEQAFIDNVKGEALMVRAYTHFMLVNLFAKQYSSTASTDLGIPYALETEKEGIVGHERNTVEFVYNQIEQDALEAIDLIDNKEIPVQKYHFNKGASYAFLSRFYLYKGDWDKCIEYSNLALQENSSVRDLIEDYYNFFDEGKYEEFAEDYASADKENIFLVNKVLEWNSYPATGFYANEFREEFNDNDLRGSLYVFNSNTTINWHCLKFIGQYKDGQQYSNVALLTVEEVLLNRAEAYVRKQSPNVNAAINDINSILKNRYENFSSLTTNSFAGSSFPIEVAVLNRIIDERRYEFCYEGYRWFDLKRFQITVEHDTEFGTIQLESDDLRFVIQIPEKELTSNELMVANPR